MQGKKFKKKLTKKFFHQQPPVIMGGQLHGGQKD